MPLRVRSPTRALLHLRDDPLPRRRAFRTHAKGGGAIVREPWGFRIAMTLAWVDISTTWWALDPSRRVFRAAAVPLLRTRVTVEGGISTEVALRLAAKH